MKSSELRIGNLVNYGGVPSEVSLVDKLFFYCESSRVPTFSEGQDRQAQPIPLTEEWLLMFGFEKTSLHYLKKNGIIIFFLNNNEFCECFLGSIIVKIKHIHQLQNLYFALTGEELTLKS